MSLISVRVDAVAAMRVSKRIKEPDPAHAAVIAELAGADGITCHLREDRRHVRDRDLYILKEVVKSKLTVRIAPSEDLIDRIREVKPYMVTLMPPDTDDLSVASGINFDTDADLYAVTAGMLKDAGIGICFLVNPDIEAIKAAARSKVDAVELIASDYVNADSMEDAESELDRLEQMAQLASKLGMMVNCGGGFNYRNIRPVIDLGLVEEFTIGHSIMARALMVGLDRAVREMVDIVHAPVPTA